ncbi:hypothetical protein [Pseudoalteromonas piscicida]|uniref:Uncharacterized protein n=1 Tax=Pseudoalteromonas piscicida TaxID=43662 RepID=A0A2A5JPZ9_PSEO7|nr:hypothetical protein [Pseudoalteromonas piscicida]PCK31447.1 hypothetical protein CEX98_12445 [Pseudoalteromonas piscicida]
MAKLDVLFEKWLEGNRLSEAELAQLQANAEYLEMMEAATQWQQHAKNYEVQTPPAQLAHQHRARVWSLAAVAAWLVVGLGVSGLWLQNLGLHQQLTVQQTQLAQQQSAIQSMLDKLDDTKPIDQTTLVQLATQVVEQNRKERSLAMNNLVDLIQAQRAQDQALLRLQLNELAEQVEQTPSQNLAQYRGNP